MSGVEQPTAYIRLWNQMILPLSLCIAYCVYIISFVACMLVLWRAHFYIISYYNEECLRNDIGRVSALRRESWDVTAERGNGQFSEEG